MNASIPAGRKLRFGPFSVDPRTGELYRNNVKVKLQSQPFQVLMLLLEKPGEIVSHDDLKRRLWPGEESGAFDERIHAAIKGIRYALRDSAEDPVYIETLPKHGYRFIAPVEKVVEEPVGNSTANLRKTLAWIVFTLSIIGAIAWYLGRHFRPHRPPTLTDTVVLIDFVNSTGDAVFDDTLQTALSVSLRQSPFLTVLSDRDVTKTLQEMTLPAGTKLTPEQARELCQRAGSKAYIVGSIDSLGSEYVLGLKAVDCQRGDTLAQEQVTAASKEKVLNALGEVASRLRGELGESLATLKKFDVPLAEATTSSLEALKFLSLSNKAQREKGNVAAIPLLERAVELDPNFALAYSNLAGAHNNLGEYSLASENAKKAYGLRERISEREKYHIEAFYYMFVTGELEKARQTYEFWSQSYPRDPDRAIILINLAGIQMIFGQWDEAVYAAREAQRLMPTNMINYGNLGLIYLAANRLAEAKATFDEALGHKLDGAFLHQNAYFLAFLQGDSAEMKRQIEWGEGKAGEEDVLLAARADTDAYYGRVSEARKWSQRAVESVERANSKETAALYQAIAAVREAELGNEMLARRAAKAALELTPGRGVKILAALAFARAGDEANAHRLAQELTKSFPLDTPLNRYWLPIIRATLEIRRHPVNALELLKPASQYDLGEVPPINCLCSIYLRGEAYLRARQGNEAVAEFQKIVDHRGIALNSIQGSLAHLGLARAYVVAGDIAKAKAAYQDFLALWKDADPDIRIRLEAEEAKLR